MFKKVLLVSAILATLTSCGSAPKAPQAAPASLVGHWIQVHSTPTENMSADITADSIRINLSMGDSTGVYWIGSFDPTKASVGTIVSNGDTDAMSTQLYASNQKTKTFTYKNGGLSYEFSIMGVSSIVYLAPGA